MMHVALIGPDSSSQAFRLGGQLSDEWEVIRIERYDKDCLRQLAGLTVDAIVSVSYDNKMPTVVGLKILQVPAAGTNLVRAEYVPTSAVICNSYGHENAIAEYVVLGMLASSQRTIQVHQEFASGRWGWNGSNASLLHSEVRGKSVCIVGLGHIGRQTARACLALGMKVTGVNRNPAAIDVLDDVHGLSSIRSLVPSADFVVVCCALTTETKHIVNEEVLDAMKSSAVLINVGRGELVDEAPLFDALKRGSIGGAVLDVWYRYPDSRATDPKPSRFPFGELDNVIMTPHYAGATEESMQRRWRQITENLERVRAGSSPQNVVAYGQLAC